MPRDEAARASSLDGSMPNPNTFAQWKRSADHHLQRDFAMTSTTQLLYRLSPPDQTLPIISSTTVGGRILAALNAAHGKLVCWEKLMTEGWPGPDNVGSSGHLQVEICRLRDRGVKIDRITGLKLGPYDGCEADRQPRLFELST